MEYNFQVPLTFQQLLALALQLPDTERKRLVTALTTKQAEPAWLPPVRMRTVEQILAPDYQYPKTNPKRLVGAWEGNESVETLLALRSK